MDLNLHSGGELISLADLERVPTPPATATHHPLPHFDLVNMVKYSLGYFGHEVVEEHHAIDKDGLRYFGVLSLRSDYGDYTDIVGLRNSADKSFPIGIAIGASVFVCSNLSFMGDHVIRRKHTQGAKRDLPGLVAEVVEPLRDQRVSQARKFAGYRETPLDECELDHLVMQLWRNDVINLQRIDDVIQAYENPPHDWGDETAWRLFNATTFALAGKVAENPSATKQLHVILDGFCEDRITILN